MWTGEPHFIVEEIVDKRIEDGELEYLLKWKGYPSSENTWESIEFLGPIKYLVDDFEKRNSQGQKGTQNLTKRTAKIAEQTRLKSRNQKKNDSEEEFEDSIDKENNSAKMVNTSNVSTRARTGNLPKSVEKEKEKEPVVSGPGRIDRDVPERIVSHFSLTDAKKNGRFYESLCFVIEWKENEQGNKPKKSWYQGSTLRNKAPALMLDYIEKFLDVIEASQFDASIGLTQSEKGISQKEGRDQVGRLGGIEEEIGSVKRAQDQEKAEKTNRMEEESQEETRDEK